MVVLLDNSAEAIIAMYGILKSGGVFSVLAATIKGLKLRYILENAESSLLITHTSKREIVAEAFDDLQRECGIIWVGPSDSIPDRGSLDRTSWGSVCSDPLDTPDDFTRESSQQGLPRIIDRDLATLIYTSGSTGEPKGVMSSHHNMVCAARSICQYLQNREDDIVLNVLPLSFDYGLYQVVMAFMYGGTVVLEKSFVYFYETLKRIQEERITGFPVVPTIAAMLLRMKDLEKRDFSSIRYVTNTGAALPVEHIRALRKIFPQARIYSMFGLTECKRVGYIAPEELDSRPTSVGKAMPNCEAFVLDDDGSVVKPGQIGELVVRGSNVMQGYWGDNELTDRTFRPGGGPSERWLYTGDLFRQDEEGYLYFVGRKDDIIKTRGEKVSPREVEEILHSIDGVAEAAVVGVPDAVLGRAVKAIVALRDGSKMTEKQILQACAKRLEDFMVPQTVEIRDVLPRTSAGKVNKRELV